MHTLSRNPRQTGLDTIRGIALINMMAYHACWDMVYVFGADWLWYRSFDAYLWQQGICWTFILLSGYCFHLGHRRVHRGLLVFGGGALVSVVTLVIMPYSPIRWGVLSFLGAASLLTIPLHRGLCRIPSGVGLLVSFALFLLLREVNAGYLGFESIRLLALPEGLYQNLFTAFLGFPPADFRSTDYFSLIPWLFLFWTGYFLYNLRRFGAQKKELWLPIATMLGRHSLLVYLLHQPVIYGLLMGLNAVNMI